MGTTHILSLTYKPKIDAVFSGECKQTIRLWHDKRPKRPGDKLILHTWQGRPYHSKWGKRLNVIIKDVCLLRFDDDITYPRIFSFTNIIWVNTDEQTLVNIAKDDHIALPSGSMLKAVLRSLNNLNTLEGTTWEIINW